MGVFWTDSAVSSFEDLDPTDQEIRQVNLTLKEVIQGSLRGVPVPFDQYPGHFLIEAGRFVLVYKSQSQSILVVDVEISARFE